MGKRTFWILTCVVAVYSCSKVTNDSHDNGSLLRQKWSLVSKNGQALRYIGRPGDYYIFENNGKLYEVYDGKTDTFNYSFDGLQTVLLYPYVNGIRSTTPINFHLDVLTNNQLVMSASSTPTGNLKDSLRK